MLRAVCGQCRRKKEHYVPGPRLKFFWDMYLLRQGGYPFKPDDLTFEEWKLLGDFTVLRRELEKET